MVQHYERSSWDVEAYLADIYICIPTGNTKKARNGTSQLKVPLKSSYRNGPVCICASDLFDIKRDFLKTAHLRLLQIEEEFRKKSFICTGTTLEMNKAYTLSFSPLKKKMFTENLAVL